MVQLMSLPPKTPSYLVSFKSRLVLPFWYQRIQVFLEKRLLNVCVCILWLLSYYLSYLDVPASTVVS